MINYADNAKRQFVEYVRNVHPEAYARAMTMGRMGDTASDPGFFSSMFDKLTTFGSTLYDIKSKRDDAKRAEQLILQQNKQAALDAQNKAIDAYTRDQYARQVAEIQRQQIESQRQQQDTVLMLGGLVLAALVGAKLLGKL